MIDKLPDNEQILILKSGYLSLKNIINHVHCNDKYPEFKNILITNPNNKYGYKYDSKLDKFILVSKKELLEELLGSRISDIDEFYEKHENKLNTRIKTAITNVVKNYETDKKYKRDVITETTAQIYNNRDIIDASITN